MTTYVCLGLVLWTASAWAWPLQNAGNQGSPPQQWPMTGAEGEKAFEMPKSMAQPFPNPPMSNGLDGSPKFPQQRASSPWMQGLGSDPWSSFQTNNPFGAGSSPFEFGTEDQMSMDSALNGLGANTDSFPFTKPYTSGMAQNQFPQPPSRPMMPDSMPEMPMPMAPGGPGGPPPPRGPMHMGNMNQMPPPPPQRHHPFGHMQMMGQRGPFDWSRVTGRSNQPEMPPPPSSLDSLGRYPIEYSPMRPSNGTVPAITVQYNVTYTFSPWGWRTVDVSVSNASFHPSTSDKAVDITGAPGGGLVQQPELNKNQDQFMTSSSWWWWPKKQQGFELNGKPNGGRPEDGIETPAFGDPNAFMAPAPSQ